MLRIDRILCPVDFSEFSVRAYDYAQSLARQYEAKLFLQHVAEPLLTLYSGYISQLTIDETYVQQTEHVQEQLRTLIARHKDRSTEPEVVLHQGYPADSILLFAQSERIDVIVIRAHGRRGFDRLVLGSVTEKVLRNSACPRYCRARSRSGYCEFRRSGTAREYS
jgi:universal stress protein A